MAAPSVSSEVMTVTGASSVGIVKVLAGPCVEPASPSRCSATMRPVLTDNGAIAIDQRLDTDEAGPERIGLDEERASAARPCLRQVEDQSRPGDWRERRIVDGHASRGREGFRHRLVEPVEQDRGRASIARGSADVLSGGKDPRRNGRQSRRRLLRNEGGPRLQSWQTTLRSTRRSAGAPAPHRPPATRNGAEQTAAGDQHQTSGESGAQAWDHDESSEYTGAIVKSIWP